MTTNMKKLQTAEILKQLDHMTGLYNYDYFLKEAQKELQNADDAECFAIFYCDILGFKALNDLYGMEEGNRQLKAFANVLTHPSRAGISARIFSDLFVKIFPLKEGEDGPGVSACLEKDMKHFLKEQSHYHPECDLKICAGICIVEEHTPRGLIAAVDNANAARKRGRKLGHTCCIYFDQDMARQITEQQQLSFDLQKALKQKNFNFYLQPKVNLKTGRIVGAEALARWIKEDGTAISPADFIPLMEKDGTIVQLDFFIYNRLAQTLRQRLDRQEPIVPISLNVSRAHLGNPLFAQQAHQVFVSYKIDPSLIEFELTENMLMENPQNAVSILNELKKYGYTAAIDDFGAGYSSLSLVAKLNVDVLKLDKSLLGSRPMVLSNRRKAVLNSITEMSRKLNLTVLCEGVETIEQAVYLNEIGCHLIQGFYIAPPVEEASFFAMLENSRAPYAFPWLCDKDSSDPIHKETTALTEIDTGSLEALNNSVFHIFPGGTMGIDPASGNILFASDTMTQLVGITANQLEQDNVKNWYDKICAPGRTDAMRANLLNQLDSRGKIDYEFAFTKPDGTLKWLSMRAGFASNGQWGQYLLCFFFDATRAHQNELELEKTLNQIEAERNFYRGLYNNVMCGIVRCKMDLTDGSTETIIVNQTAAHIFGFQTPEELKQATGNCLCDLIAKENHDKIRAQLPALNKEDGFHLRTSILRGDGKEAWVDCYFQLVQRSESNLIFQMLFLDCTDIVRKESESAYFDALYQQAGCGLMIHRITKDGYECVRINKEAVKIFEIESAAEFINRFKLNHAAYFHPDDFKGVQKKLKKLKKYGDSISFYHRIQLDSGEIKWIYNTEKMLKDQDGCPILLGTIVDCTQRKELELRLEQEKEQISLLYNSSSCGIFQFQWDGKFIKINNINQQAMQLLGLQADNAICQQYEFKQAFMSSLDKDYALIMQKLDELDQPGRQVIFQHRLCPAGGKTSYVEATLCLLTVENELKTLQCTLVDITQRKKLEERLENYYSNVSKLMHQSIFIFDFKEDILSFHSKDRDMDHIPQEIKNFTPRYRAGEFPDLTLGNLLTESVYSSKSLCSWNNIEYKITALDGRSKWLSCSLYLTRDENGLPESGMGCLQDITQNVLERQRLRHLSETDRLTGLLNKGTAEEKCRRYLEVIGDKKQCALLIIDLDNFKNTNDTNGHQFGDKVLHQFGRRLQALIRKDDIIGRIGGDEFLVLLKDISAPEIAVKRGAAICDLMNDVALWLNFPGISCSVGIAIAPEHGVDYEQLLQSADEALYCAKEAGKNQHYLYIPPTIQT